MSLWVGFENLPHLLPLSASCVRWRCDLSDNRPCLKTTKSSFNNAISNAENIYCNDWGKKRGLEPVELITVA